MDNASGTTGVEKISGRDRSLGARVGRLDAKLSVRRKLLGIAAVGIVLMAVLTGAALQGFSRVANANAKVSDLEDASHLVAGSEIQNLQLEAVAAEALLTEKGVGDLSRAEADLIVRSRGRALGDALDALRRIETTTDIRRTVAELTPQMKSHAKIVKKMVTQAYTDPVLAALALPGLQRASATFAERLDRLHTAIDRASASAQADAKSSRERTSEYLVGVGVAAVLVLLALSYLLGRSIMRSLRQLGETARSIAGGDLSARTDQTGADEIGELGLAFNTMANELQSLMAQLAADAERDSFAGQLTEAFEMADTEPDAHRVVERAMTAVAPDRPMELLLADSSKAHLERCAAHPAAGAPGCSVESPFACVAVRRGNPVIFENSEALNACPKLRGRAAGACSAVCVPVTFMGRALGVLHTSGPEQRPPSTEQVAQLTTLATQAGGRIGTVRSFERSRRQASNDGLTGLLNRRTFEGEARALLRDDVPFALAIADLDHFKLLNDTYGHEAGDRALRRFAETVRSFVRADDLVCRYGGEEFVVVFPGMSVTEVVDVVDRLRVELTEADPSIAPSCTASFGVTDSSVGVSLDEIVRVADAALYRAKQEGRNRVTVGDPSDACDPGRSALEDRSVPAGRSRRPASAFEAAAYDDDPMPELPVA
jgi:diguanylate cyclase (GGDEF)-like protein